MKTRDVLVLCYHAVSRSWPADLSISPAALDAQIGHLVGRGWRPSTFTDAALGTEPGRVLAITFDDAFASVRDRAAPILRRHGAVATVFAPTAFMEGHRSLEWPGVSHWTGSDHAGELRAMDWADLAELADGGWEIGSHTCTHPHLTTVDDATLTRELEQSRAVSTERLGRPCRAIAYPYGDMDERVSRAAKDAGYEAGACLARDLRQLGPLEFPRIGIYHLDSWPRFRLKMAAPTRRLRATGLL